MKANVMAGRSGCDRDLDSSDLHCYCEDLEETTASEHMLSQADRRLPTYKVNFQHERYENISRHPSAVSVVSTVQVLLARFPYSSFRDLSDSRPQAT